MPTLAEILAAKKAAQQPATTPAPTPAPPKSFEKVEVDPAVASAVQAQMDVKTVAEPVKEEPATAPAKKLSFAEMMALKKQQNTTPSAEQKPSTNTTGNGENTIPDSSPKPVAPTATTAPVQAATSSPAVPAPSPVSVATTTPQSETTLSSNEEASPEARQAYADIKEKINLLNTMSGDDLKNAMSNLKKALMANPAAVSLMEDSDIGQMVIALRKVTGETIAEASAEKKPGRKAKTKEVDLSNPDIMAQVFEEL